MHQEESSVFGEAKFSLSPEQLGDLNKKIRERLQYAFGQDVYKRKNDPTFIEQMKKVIEFALSDLRIQLEDKEKQFFIQYVLDDILGLGLLQPLLDDPSITEIMVVGPNKVYVEQAGKIRLTNLKFPNEDAVKLMIDKIVSPIGRRCDESTPNVDARLPDGSRVSATIAPIALDGPYITIRKFSKKTFTLENYIERGSISPEMAHLGHQARC